MKRILRVYCDTSVFGGCREEEFSEDSNDLMEMFRQGEHRLVLSRVTLRELAGAPGEIQKILTSIPPQNVDFVQIGAESESLRQAYLSAGVVGPSSRRDALHIAVATIARVDLIVSWNFKHIVHFEKIIGYHGINRLHGYPEIPIHTPKEVIRNAES